MILWKVCIYDADGTMEGATYPYQYFATRKEAVAARGQLSEMSDDGSTELERVEVPYKVGPKRAVVKMLYWLDAWAEAYV
jgi:hypothetical protein